MWLIDMDDDDVIETLRSLGVDEVTINYSVEEAFNTGDSEFHVGRRKIKLYREDGKYHIHA